jgi:hypothetical protein
LLALWAAKTAIMLMASHPDLREFVPQSHRDSVRRAVLPPTNCWVGYYPWEGDVHVFGSDNVLTFTGVNPPLRLESQSYSSVFTFRRLGFAVVGFIDGPPSGRRISGQTDMMKQFWPSTSGLIHWPPIGEVPSTPADVVWIIRFAPLI